MKNLLPREENLIETEKMPRCCWQSGSKFFILRSSFFIFYAFSFLRMSNPSRTMRCNSSFEESTNSAMAKSSGATS